MSENNTVTIQYCVPCGHLPRALSIQESILEHFGRNLAGVTLKTGGDGIFTIHAAGEQVYDKAEELNLDALLKTISEKTGASPA
ncbi:MAG TPA: Rdx family protein [Deinococcales bacterium]|nr:Rdx family protein [Deinococcales bacterium]